MEHGTSVVHYLVLSDIHANLEALQAVLAVAEPQEGTLFLGDLVGYGPNPNECATMLRAQPNLTSVVGNHDVAALGQIDLDTFNTHAKAAVEWTQREMSEQTRSYLASLGQMEETDCLTMVHGSPRDPVWEYLENDAHASENFARFTTPICFVGHTHVPRILSQDPRTKESAVHTPGPQASFETRDDVRRIVNPGSVGQPRDGDPRASFGLFDSASGLFEYRRVAYDVERTQAKMKKAGLPRPLADRLAFGI